MRISNTLYRAYPFSLLSSTLLLLSLLLLSSAFKPTHAAAILFPYGASDGDQEVYLHSLPTVHISIDEFR